MKKLFVLSLGGSLIAPNGVDSNFIKKFRQLILARIKKGDRFIIVTGGGKTCRMYQQALKQIFPSTNTDLDWLGISINHMHANMFRIMFGKLAHQEVVTNPNKKVHFKEKVLLSGGWVPGRSSDDTAVRFAKTYGSDTVVNMTNIDYVYDKDPRKFKNAKKIEHITWSDYRKLLGIKRTPGMNSPFDPVAAQFAAKNKQRVIIANGANLQNLKLILTNKSFRGTTID